MTDDLAWILDDLFHGCARQAYLEQTAIAGGSPDSETTRSRAYELYEQALAERQSLSTVVWPCVSL